MIPRFQIVDDCLESRIWVTIAFYADEALVVTSPRLGKTVKINAMERQRT